MATHARWAGTDLPAVTNVATIRLDKTAEVIAVVVLVERDVTSSMERVSVDVLRAGYMSTVLLVGWFNFRSLVLESNESSLWQYTVYRTL